VRIIDRMAVLRLTQVIDRSPAEVFDVVSRAGDFATWNPTIRASRQLSPGPIGTGTKVEWDLRGFGKVEQELQEFEPNHRVRIVPHLRQLSGGHRFTLTAVGESTRVDHELEMTPKSLFKLMGPMMTMMGRRNLRATADALKVRAETEIDGGSA
jgi:uncharacterized protein YndB with AHSA1/START domain